MLMFKLQTHISRKLYFTIVKKIESVFTISKNLPSKLLRSFHNDCGQKLLVRREDRLYIRILKPEVKILK